MCMSVMLLVHLKREASERMRIIASYERSTQLLAFVLMYESASSVSSEYQLERASIMSCDSNRLPAFVLINEFFNHEMIEGFKQRKFEYLRRLLLLTLVCQIRRLMILWFLVKINIGFHVTVDCCSHSLDQHCFHLILLWRSTAVLPPACALCAANYNQPKSHEIHQFPLYVPAEKNVQMFDTM